MSEIIAATAAEALEAIASAPGQTAGQSIEQWLQDAKMIRELQEIGKPVYNWSYDPAADEAFSKIVDETAADGAWQAWKEGGGNISSGGNASPSPTVKVTPETAINKGGLGTVGGLLTMSLPTWTAAVAPLLGVAVGVGMYELAPEFWEKVSRTLLPFCYEDTQTMPVVTDEDGNTYVDKEAFDALRHLFEEEGIGGDAHTASDWGEGDWAPSYQRELPISAASVSTIAYQVNENERWLITGCEYIAQWANRIYIASRTPIICQEIPSYSANFAGGSFTIDGETYYYASATNAIDSWGQISVPTLPSSWTDGVGSPAADFAKAVYHAPVVGGVYPEGTQKWLGDAVDVDTLPTIDVYTDPEDSTKTQDFIPVALPTVPGQSLNPEENPDPTTNSDPERQISPYLNPAIPEDQFPDGSKLPDIGTIAPIPTPFPNPDPKPDADADPSQPSDTPPGKLVDILPGFDPGVTVPIPDNPTLPGPTAAGGDGGVGGLVSVYNPTYAELTSFSQWLWVTYADATIDKIWNNPFDGIISLHELYATPDKGSRKYIKSGFLVSPVDSITIPNRYTEINCGTAIFPEFYGNYLDYSPYSKALCYLPFIGIVELNVDDIVGHTVNITYHVDSYSGACIALIDCVNDRSSGVLYQFSGNCSVQMPIAGGSQAAIKAAQISAGAYQNAYHIAGLAGLAGGVASGIGSLLSLNLGGALSGAVNGIGSYMSNQAQGQAAAVSQTVSAKSSVQHSGQFGESFGAMGNKKPYMILKRPVQVQVPNYQSEYGYPAHKYVNISECTGYIRCRGVHVLSARATDSEKHMIEQALTEGVYVT